LKDFSKFKVDMIIEVAHPSITCEFGAEFLKFSNFFCGSPTALADLKLETILRYTAETSILFEGGAKSLSQS
jgi:hypothetical protein